MTKEEIVKYITSSPENTNPNVLEGMLDQLGGGGSSDYSIAKVTIIVNLTQADLYGSFQGENTTLESVNSVGEHNLILYKGNAHIHADGTIDNPSGDISLINDNNGVVTGDCSLSLITDK